MNVFREERRQWQFIGGARMCSDDRVALEFEGSGQRDRARLEGKAQSSRNAWKGGHWRMLRELSRQVSAEIRAARELVESNKRSGCWRTFNRLMDRANELSADAGACVGQVSAIGRHRVDC